MRLIVPLLLLSVTAGCTVHDPTFCNDEVKCTDPDRPFCDVEGQYPASEGISFTCIPSPVDAGVVGVDSAVTVTFAGTGGGSVTSSPAGIDCDDNCDAAFPAGTEVTLTAVPSATSVFRGWSGGECAGSGLCVVAADAHADVTATFDLQQYALEVSIGGDGTGEVTATGIDCGSDCSETFPSGAIVQLTASPTGESRFGGWSGDCAGLGTTCSVTMDRAKSVGAAFDLNAVSLSISLAGTGGGSVTSAPGDIACPGACADSYDAGAQVQLTATPDATSTFDGWSGCAGTGTTCMVDLDAATSVVAVFTRVTYSVSVTTTGTGGGTVTSSPAALDCGDTCVASFDAATNVILIQSADPGSVFRGWSGDCDGSGVCAFTLDGPASVGAEFCAPRSCDSTMCGPQSDGCGGTIQCAACLPDAGPPPDPDASVK